MPRKRHLEIGHATFGEEFRSSKGANLGLDPEANPTVVDLPPNFIQIIGEAEHLPIRSNSLDRVTSTDAVGNYSNIDESFEEIVRVLKPRGSTRVSIGGDILIEELKDILKQLPITNLRIVKKIDDPKYPEETTNTIVTFRKL